MDSIRVAKISSINRAKGRARVIYSQNDAVSPEIPFLFYEIYPYQVDDLVWVAKLSGTTAEAVIIGMAFADGTPPAEEMAEGLYRKDLSRTAGKAVIRYSETDDTLTIKATGNIKIIADGELNIEATAGDVKVNGISLVSHTHISPVSGGTTSTPN